MKGLAFCAVLVGVFALCMPAWSQSQLEAKWSQPVDTMTTGGQISETCPVTIPSPGVQDDRSADDWQCTDGEPIAVVKWWGDYHRYDEYNAGPVDHPDFKPTSFILRQYANDDTDPSNTKPGDLIREVEIPFADCNETYVQSVKFSDGPPADYIHIFSYQTTLILPWEQEKDAIYWISIQAKFDASPQEQTPIPFMNWEWLYTPDADFLGAGLVSYDAGVTWMNPYDPDKKNFAFELYGLSPLAMVPSALTAGEAFSIYLALTEDIVQPFDFYLFAETPAGLYTIFLNGKVQKGLIPLYSNVPRFTKDYITTIRPSVKIPVGMKGKTVTFYSAVIEAGKIPPVSKPSDITPDTPYVILPTKNSVVVD